MSKASFFNLEDALKQNFFEKEFTHIETIIESNHEAVFRHLDLLDKNGSLLEPKNSTYLSFSSLKQQSATLKTDDVLKGRDYGDLFHNLIEDLLKSGRYQNFQDPQNRNYIKRLIDLSPFSTHSEEILNHLEGALKFQFPINDQSFCLLQIPLEDLYIEESFSYQTDQGIMKGFIDCIVVFQNEVFFIDWKTTLLPDVSADSIAKHMQEASYFLQLDIYKKALDHFCNYFQGKIISKAFYVFIKNQVCFEKNFKEFICLN
jgi:ATP-dependent exoDNAse (exonuclease V) beta subunit